MNAKLTLLLLLLLALFGVLTWQVRRGAIQLGARKSPQKEWREIVKVDAMDSSFTVTEWKAFSSGTGAGIPSNVRKSISGEFQSGSPVVLALMDGKNFERLRNGFPPLPIATFRPGPVTAQMPAGKAWLVFIQASPHAGPDPFPTTGLQLGLALLKRLQEANLPPSRVTARLSTVFTAYMTDAEAAGARAEAKAAVQRLKERAARASQVAPQFSPQPLGGPAGLGPPLRFKPLPARPSSP